MNFKQTSRKLVSQNYYIYVQTHMLLGTLYGFFLFIRLTAKARHFLTMIYLAAFKLRVTLINVFGKGALRMDGEYSRCNNLIYRKCRYFRRSSME